MTDHASPIWVRDRNGQTVPFEADRICQSLFAATEHLGVPNAFLARELTDGVVHFLSEETNGSLPSTDELPELIAKIVRELGQPVLANRFAQISLDGQTPPVSAPRFEVWRERISACPPPMLLARAAVNERLTEFSLSDVFPTNLVAADRDGLLTLFGLDHPLELSGSVLGSGDRPQSAGQGMLEAFERAREQTGGYVAIDAPEFALAALPGEPADLTAAYVRELGAAAKMTGLAVILNLNIASPPSWDRDLGVGPLFAEIRQESDPLRVAQLADAMRDRVLSLDESNDPTARIEVAWHLSGADFAKDANQRLQTVCRAVSSGHSITFHFDRPRHQVSLAPGLNRRYPAVLTAIGVHLSRLAEQTSDVTVDGFLRKLGTLARLARSGGHAKQDFLRRRSRPAVTRGFLLDRARLIVVPVGLETVVRRLTGERICDGGHGEEVAGQVLTRLREALAHEKPRTMDAGLDTVPLPVSCNVGDHSASNNWDGATSLTTWDADADAQTQLRANGKLHAVADGGCVTVGLAPANAETMAALLRYAWTHTDVRRVRFECPK